MDLPNWPVVDVWRIDLAVSDTCTAQELAVLSNDELDRADRFMLPKHRRRFVRRRAALRRILAGYLGTAPAQVMFEYLAKGKPEIPRCAGGPALQFNCSDTCEIALIAVATDVIGIDIEWARRRSNLAGLIKTVCTDAEAKTLEPLNQDRKRQEFFRIWAAKEALIKLTGEGLSANLQAIETNLSSDPIVAAQAGRSRSLTELDFGADFGAMLATGDTNNRPQIRQFDFPEHWDG